MLHDFLSQERAEVLALARKKAREVNEWRVTASGMDESWDALLDEIILLMQEDRPFEVHNERGQHTVAAEKHGRVYQRRGFSLSDVVHSYGVLCQAITEHADDRQYEITAREFQQLNLSLDTAIAEAVMEFDRVRKGNEDDHGVEGLGILAYDLRNCVRNITITLEMIQTGSVGARSNTGVVLARNIRTMSGIIDGELTNVRLSSQPELTFVRTKVLDLMHEVGVTAGFDVRSKKLTLLMQSAPDIEVVVDKQLFVAALGNIVQQAVTFSKPGGTIRLRSHQVDDRIRTEIETECTGISEDEMVKKMGGLHHDGTSAGRAQDSALSIAKRAIEENRGVLLVEYLPDEKCIFIMDLPAELPSS